MALCPYHGRPDLAREREVGEGGMVTCSGYPITPQVMLIHTARDRDWDRERDWKKWISIYYAEVFILHGTRTGTGTRTRNGKFGNGFYTHFSGPSLGPGLAFPCPGLGSVQCERAIRPGLGTPIPTPSAPSPLPKPIK